MKRFERAEKDLKTKMELVISSIWTMIVIAVLWINRRMVVVVLITPKILPSYFF